MLTVASIIGCSEQESTPAATQTAANSAVRDTAKGLDYDFYKESIEPIFIRYRGGFVGSDTACVACHTVQANAPLGLEPLTQENGEVFWTEEQSQMNFQNVAMLVNPSAPETSRLLLAPLAPIVGGEMASFANKLVPAITVSLSFNAIVPSGPVNVLEPYPGVPCPGDIKSSAVIA